MIRKQSVKTTSLKGCTQHVIEFVSSRTLLFTYSNTDSIVRCTLLVAASEHIAKQTSLSTAYCIGVRLETLSFTAGPQCEAPCLQCTEYNRHNDKHGDRYSEAPLTVSHILQHTLHHINNQRGEDEGRLFSAVGSALFSAPHCSIHILSLLLYHFTSTTISQHITHSMTAYKILSGPSLRGKITTHISST